MASDPKLFAANETTAQEKYAEFKAHDPFYHKINSALLSSADIEDYVRVAGMIYPFDKKFLKPVTYALVAGGPYVSFKNGKRIEGELKKGRYLELEKDSILFLTLEPLIQLPNYIAARFNLTINHVYRGLLLGTGPVVDPGFVGRISIPLHNFTSNNYIIKGGEKLVWMEFTKVARNHSFCWEQPSLDRKGKIVEFDSSKNNRKLSDYIYDADKRSIESSIPQSVTKSEDSAKKAQESVKSAENITKVIVGLNLAIVIATITLSWNVYKDTRTFYKDAKAEVSDESRALNNDTKTQLINLTEKRRAFDSLKIHKLEQQIDSIKSFLNKRKK